MKDLDTPAEFEEMNENPLETEVQNTLQGDEAPAKLGEKHIPLVHFDITRPSSFQPDRLSPSLPLSMNNDRRPYLRPSRELRYRGFYAAAILFAALTTLVILFL